MSGAQDGHDAATADIGTLAAPGRGLPGADAPQQFRIVKVQLLNWGGYTNLQTMQVGRNGHAILGPTGAGKSQILDAIAAVLMPNPQEFNQAARDDRGQRSERTVYTYARGKTDDTLDADGRSTSTEYLRPPGTEFPCAIAVTWSTHDGRTVTAMRLAWVWNDTTTQDEITSTTVYAFIEDDFDLQRLTELRPTRDTASPITTTTVGKLLPQALPGADFADEAGERWAEYPHQQDDRHGPCEILDQRRHELHPIHEPEAFLMTGTGATVGRAAESLVERDPSSRPRARTGDLAGTFLDRCSCGFRSSLGGRLGRRPGSGWMR